MSRLLIHAPSPSLTLLVGLYCLAIGLIIAGMWHAWKDIDVHDAKLRARAAANADTCKAYRSGPR